MTYREHGHGSRHRISPCASAARRNQNHEYRVGLTRRRPQNIAHGQGSGRKGAGAGTAPTTTPTSAGAAIARTAEDVFAIGHDRQGEGTAPNEWSVAHRPDPLPTSTSRSGSDEACSIRRPPSPVKPLPTTAAGSSPSRWPEARPPVDQAGATTLQTNGGRGVLLGGVPGVLPGKVAIIGGGVVGLHAAKMAAGLGADVSIIDRSIRACQLDDIFNGRVHPLFEHRGSRNVSRPTSSRRSAHPRRCTQIGHARDAVRHEEGGSRRRCHRPGRLLQTSHATTHADPTYEVDGIIHYCVANMPGAVPVTSAHALNNATALRPAGRQGHPGHPRRPTSQERPQRPQGPHHQPRRRRGARLRDGRTKIRTGGLSTAIKNTDARPIRRAFLIRWNRFAGLPVFSAAI